MRSADRLVRWIDDLNLPLSTGAFVMATAVISIGLRLTGSGAPSAVLLVGAAAAWLALAATFLARAVLDPSRLRREARSPAALTAVAGTAVLGQRLLELGHPAIADAAFGLGVCLWLVLIPGVVAHRSNRAAGSSFLLAVSTESLAALAASCALAKSIVWLAIAGLILFLVGLGAYSWVVATLDPRLLGRGPGDQWIGGGALAIASLACAELADTVGALTSLRSLRTPLADTSLGLWIAAAVWLPVLTVDELRCPRLRYDIRRWSTVFPLGMYAVASAAVGRTTSTPELVTFARAWIWIAFVAWLALAIAALRRALTIATTP